MCASAILAYGFDCGDEPPFTSDPDGDTDFGQYLALKAGHKNPWDEAPELNDGGITTEQYRQWQENNPELDRRTTEWARLTNKLEAEAPVQLVYHCSGDYTEYILAVKGHVFRADWGSPHKFEQTVAQPSALDVIRASEFLKGVDIEAPPIREWTWLLASYYA